MLETVQTVATHPVTLLATGIAVFLVAGAALSVYGVLAAVLVIGVAVGVWWCR